LWGWQRRSLISSGNRSEGQVPSCPPCASLVRNPPSQRIGFWRGRSARCVAVSWRRRRCRRKGSVGSSKAQSREHVLSSRRCSELDPSGLHANGPLEGCSSSSNGAASLEEARQQLLDLVSVSMCGCCKAVTAGLWCCKWDAECGMWDAGGFAGKASTGRNPKLGARCRRLRDRPRLITAGQVQGPQSPLDQREKQ
jgi:hypothetical protein